MPAPRLRPLRQVIVGNPARAASNNLPLLASCVESANHGCLPGGVTAAPHPSIFVRPLGARRHRGGGEATQQGRGAADCGERGEVAGAIAEA